MAAFASTFYLLERRRYYAIDGNAALHVHIHTHAREDVKRGFLRGRYGIKRKERQGGEGTEENRGERKRGSRRGFMHAASAACATCGRWRTRGVLLKVQY